MTSTISAAGHRALEDAEPQDRSRPIWLVVPLALVGWVAGLAPWLVNRSVVGTTGNPWNPRNDLRQAWLPFHHEHLVLLVTLTAALATTVAVMQTLAPDPDFGGTGDSDRWARIGLVVLTSLGVGASLVLGLVVSLGAPAAQAVAAAPLAVAGQSWLGLLVAGQLDDGGSEPTLSRAWLTLIAVAAGVVAGSALAAAPPVTAARVVAWVLALALMRTAQSVVTALVNVLGQRQVGSLDRAALLDRADHARDVFTASLTPSATAWTPLVTAVVVGLVGAVLVHRHRAARRGAVP